MNNQRRKAIQEVMEQLSAPLDTITDLKEQLEAIMDEEQEYYDNMPESLQGGEKGDMAQEAIDQINEAVCDVLRQGNAFVSKIINEIESTPEGTVILLTEGELLHPFFRTRTIESCLHDRVKNPTVIFYPGRRSGQYGLHFLGFYPVDGNYRSTLLGGL